MKTIELASATRRTPAARASSATNERLAQAQAIISLAALYDGESHHRAVKTALAAAQDTIDEVTALLSFVFDGFFDVDTIAATNDRLGKAKAIISLVINADASGSDMSELACGAAVSFLQQAMERLESEVE